MKILSYNSLFWLILILKLFIHLFILFIDLFSINIQFNKYFSIKITLVIIFHTLLLLCL